jgi:hypothetical protein
MVVADTLEAKAVVPKDEKGTNVVHMIMQLNDLLMLRQLEKNRRNLPSM